MKKVKVHRFFKGGLVAIAVLLFLIPKSFSQEPVISYVKINGKVNAVIKIGNRQLKTVFLYDTGAPITESGFYDSLSSDNYIYKSNHNASGESIYFHNAFLINKTKDSAIFQLENKSSYFRKNIGSKIDTNSWLTYNEAYTTKETDNSRKMSVAYVFNSYCPNCFKRLISFDSLHKENPSFNFLALMLDSSKSVARFYKRKKLGFHLFSKQEILCSALPTACDQAPFFLIIEDNGIVTDCFDGNENGIQKIRQMFK